VVVVVGNGKREERVGRLESRKRKGKSERDIFVQVVNFKEPCHVDSFQFLVCGDQRFLELAFQSLSL